MAHVIGHQTTVSQADRVRQILQCRELLTPAFIYDEDKLLDTARSARRAADAASGQLLYSLKACSVRGVLEQIAEQVRGFSCSSLFESRLARELAGDGRSVHYASPGLRADELGALAEVCDYVTFNSLGQWRRLKPQAAERVSCGLRINPQLPFIEDDRYNPCRRHSKLGVPLEQLVAAVEAEPALLEGLRGLHFHTNCDCDSFAPLLKTVRHIDEHLSGLLGRLEWVNLGGGYLFGKARDLDAFHEAVGLPRREYGLEVFVEPGAAIVREAGYIASSVLDIFDSGGKTVAVLDTAVNHMAEVFEYQYRHSVAGDVTDGKDRYVLAGCTCLAGDLFGEYAFQEPLEVGARVVFTEAGAYTTVKWNHFNGVNLPAIYALTGLGRLVLKKRFTYQDFAARCGAD